MDQKEFGKLTPLKKQETLLGMDEDTRTAFLDARARLRANLKTTVERAEYGMLDEGDLLNVYTQQKASDYAAESHDAYADMIKNRPLFYCTTKRECEQYGKDDILKELDRRGYTVSKDTSVWAYEEKNTAIQKGMQFSGTSEYVQVGDKYQVVPAMEDMESANYRSSGTDAAGRKRYVKVRAEVTQNTTKPQLIKVLLGAIKRDDDRRRREMKMKTKYSTCGSQKGFKGALPSETTNPSMYDQFTGLLKTEYLTQDHVGVTVPDALGNKFRVEWTPFPNGRGKAYWSPVNKMGAMEGAIQPFQLVGNFILDKRGLPLISQLNYWEHRGKVFTDRDGNVWQVQCKNPKKRSDKNHGTANCPISKCGEVAITWGRYDPEVVFVDEANTSVAADKKFNTPMGVYSYEQLMKLNLDDILKMMIVLELMEEGPKYADQMKKFGIGADGLTASETMVSVPGRGVMPLKEYAKLQGISSGLGVKKTKTSLTPFQRQMEESLYNAAGMYKCEFPKPGIRCYSDSYIPGTCVPDEEICFQGKYRQKYLNNLDKLGRDGKIKRDMMNEVVAKSENISDVITATDADYAKIDARLAKQGPLRTAMAHEAVRKFKSGPAKESKSG